MTDNHFPGTVHLEIYIPKCILFKNEDCNSSKPATAYGYRCFLLQPLNKIAWKWEEPPFDLFPSHLTPFGAVLRHQHCSLVYVTSSCSLWCFNTPHSLLWCFKWLANLYFFWRCLLILVGFLLSVLRASSCSPLSIPDRFPAHPSTPCVSLPYFELALGSWYQNSIMKEWLHGSGKVTKAGEAFLRNL